jgi:hypothetical protein
MNYPGHTGAHNLRQKVTLALSRRHFSPMRSGYGHWYIGSLALYLLCVVIVFFLVVSVLASPDLLGARK